MPLLQHTWRHSGVIIAWLIDIALQGNGACDGSMRTRATEWRRGRQVTCAKRRCASQRDCKAALQQASLEVSDEQ